MNEKIREAFWREIHTGKDLYVSNAFNKAFKHFERAHVLGQSNAFLHTYAHICMLKVGFAKKDFKEILGQLLRIPTGFIGSLIGVYPQGNTGGSDISPFKSLEIPEDLTKILNLKKDS